MVLPISGEFEIVAIVGESVDKVDPLCNSRPLRKSWISTGR